MLVSGRVTLSNISFVGNLGAPRSEGETWKSSSRTSFSKTFQDFSPLKKSLGILEPTKNIYV